MKKITYTIIIPLFVTVAGGLTVAKTQNIDFLQFFINIFNTISNFLKKGLFIQVPIWSILILGLFTFFLKKIFIKQKNHTTLSKNYLDVFDEMSLIEQEILKVIILLHEINKERTIDNILKTIKNETIFKLKLTRLEITQGIENLVNKEVLSPFSSAFDRYDLTKYGRDIGVALIQYSKKIEDNKSHKDKNDL
jgi:hypothetical protein